MNPEKLARLQAAVRIGGKGAPRRKVVKKPAAAPAAAEATTGAHKTSAAEEKRLEEAIKKMQLTYLPTAEEVNMFREDGRVLHFKYPKGAWLLGPS